MSDFERGPRAEQRPGTEDLEKVRGFTRSKERDIFSADPNRGDGAGDLGSMITVLLIGRDRLSRNELVETILSDGVAEEQMEAERKRAESTINNLIDAGVIVETDKGLSLAL